jgi:hypothetical protein
MKRKGVEIIIADASDHKRQLAIYRDPRLFKDIIATYLVKYLDVNTYRTLKNTCRYFYKTLLISDHPSYDRFLLYYNAAVSVKFSSVRADASILFWYFLYRGFICHMKPPVRKSVIFESNTWISFKGFSIHHPTGFVRAHNDNMIRGTIFFDKGLKQFYMDAILGYFQAKPYFDLSRSDQKWVRQWTSEYNAWSKDA